jgi:microsomal epoxide hydrolase
MDGQVGRFLHNVQADPQNLHVITFSAGSFLEFMPIFHLLKDKYTPETLPYHVIVPSLPGYAFSSGPPLDKNFGTEDAARVLDRLMSMLGFGDGYVVQGGDIGARVARLLAATYTGCKGEVSSPLTILQD